MTIALGDATDSLAESEQTASQTIRHYGYQPNVGTRPYTMRLAIAELRDRANIVYNDAQDLHHNDQANYLTRLAATKARADVPSLLKELSNERGLAWRDIASLVDVSVSAVRKWRTGGDATPISRQSLATLAAFLDVLEEYAIADPASWMEIPLPLPEGYTVRPFDLYLAGHHSQLLDIAGQRASVTDVLDAVDVDWRMRRSDYTVYEAEDGQRAIKRREP